MEPKPLDRIFVQDLLLRCIIGIRAWERTEKQNVNVCLTLHADLSEAGRSDAIGDTVDYVGIKKRIIALVEGSSFQLIEALAERIAEVCLTEPRVQRVDVSLEKPGALRFARTVAVEISRFRPEPEELRHDAP
ncbi:MAG: dihydroneopterin aldolase [Armatimonadetes bacterium]|nr:dihydroneopterin aldolase [Armatimonadota bacterium]